MRVVGRDVVGEVGFKIRTLFAETGTMYEISSNKPSKLAVIPSVISSSSEPIIGPMPRVNSRSLLSSNGI
jgi:hypothetical protein